MFNWLDLLEIKLKKQNNFCQTKSSYKPDRLIVFRTWQTSTKINLKFQMKDKNITINVIIKKWYKVKLKSHVFFYQEKLKIIKMWSFHLKKKSEVIFKVTFTWTHFARNKTDPSLKMIQRVRTWCSEKTIANLTPNRHIHWGEIR